jgi:hypothetical protein
MRWILDLVPDRSLDDIGLSAPQRVTRLKQAQAGFLKSKRLFAFQQALSWLHGARHTLRVSEAVTQ